MEIADLIEKKLLPNLVKQTCQKLNKNKKELKNLNWHSGESNTDLDFSNLSRSYCEQSFNEFKESKQIELEISIPDLNLTFKDSKNKNYKTKIELKSTKSVNGKIPGSTVMNLDPNVWTIMCYRSDNNKTEVRYGRYYLGMDISEDEKFQDRSPRPSLNFFKFQKYTEDPNMKKVTKDESFWKKYATSAIRRVLKPTNHSWQDDLIKEIIKEVLKNPNKFKNI